MCGILGFSGKYHALDKFKFKSALQTLNHRGPDGEGIFIENNILFGHKRLSIIDLSKNGSQPMIDSKSGCVLTFNGEIYNYLELKKSLKSRGHSFSSNTDSEVLLKAYIEWGYECVNYFNGMWSFAIYDPKNKNIFFSRDRFGVKPFYYTVDKKENFIFASEPKAINSIVKNVEVNFISLFNFLVNSSHFRSNSSYYRNISTLPAAHCGTFNIFNRKLKIWKYWDYTNVKLVYKNKSDYFDQFFHLFDSAVKIRLRSDVPVGLTYSGGIDSTAILASMQKEINSFTAFNSSFPEFEDNENKWAKIGVNQYPNVKLASIVSPIDRWIESMEKIIWHLDSPTFSPAVYPLWFLMRSAKEKGVPVLLEGQGADEELGGYTWYSILHFLNIVFTKFKISDSSKESLKLTFSFIIKSFGSKQVFLWFLREIFPKASQFYQHKYGINKILKPEFFKFVNWDQNQRVGFGNHDTVTKRMILDHSSYILPSLLHYGDSISMAHSIESRHPFLDYRLVEWLFSVPDNVKIFNGITKYVLREYLNINNQQKIASRFDKKGYSTPLAEWLLLNNSKILNETILCDNSKISDYIDRSLLIKYVSNLNPNDSQKSFHIFKLITAEMWLKKCF